MAAYCFRRVVLSCTFFVSGVSWAWAGSIAGYAHDFDDASLYEMEITQCRSGESTNLAWARISNNGYYEIKDLAAGEYSLVLGDLYYFRPKLFSFVPVREDIVTPGTFQVDAAYFVRVRATEKSPACREIRQTFVATGDVVKVTVWTFDNAALYCSIHDAITHERIGPARDQAVDAADSFTWRHGEVPALPGQSYYVKLWRPDNGEFSLSVCEKKGGRSYGPGHAFYDGRPEPQADIRCVIECDDDGLWTMAQWQRTDGKGHGSTHIGQTFKAIGSFVNVVTLFGTAIEGQYVRTRFSIHEDGPEGRQVGPTKTCHPWNYRPMGQVYSVSWQPGEVPVTSGRTYYLKALADEPGLFAFTNKHDGYPLGRCYFGGTAGPENEDLCFTVLGEAELHSSLSTLKGTVKTLTNKAIPGATVTLNPWGYSVKSRPNGEYTLSRVTAGRYAVCCSADGYRPRTFVVTLRPAATHEMDFTLTSLTGP
ncbi:MAG TPA: carboxypeptidase-like regulatory domain-containing protein [Phycisphaerae bacterium]|nr:carboxypeptidase-like regulatory domain-containing protein [Phycisphaerae bacterium]HRR87013.1 carboxypeptidase-like regulatory domain-containing protein [Phycisphaerae bacterium]